MQKTINETLDVIINSTLKMTVLCGELQSDINDVKINLPLKVKEHRKINKKYNELNEIADEIQELITELDYALSNEIGYKE